MSIRTLRGMRDVLPEETPFFQEVEYLARRVFGRHCYEEIRTPLLEEMALFSRTLGETTSVVEKEMYSFQDKGDKLVALRPEGTASVVRAYIESGRAVTDPIARYYYIGPMYRRERPQKGRYREFHQIGVEVLGIASPLIDAEVIHMLDLYLKEVGLENFEVEINSLGCPVCRPQYHRAFHAFLAQNRENLCPECQRRMEKNPLRVLDCKEEGCKKISDEAPSIQEFLCNTCEKDFDLVLETLGSLGSVYKINPRIVRGLDYYIKTTFEVTTPDLGAQNAIAGGGRYDGLVRLLGGPNIPGVGFAIGEERLVEILREKKIPIDRPTPDSVYLASIGEKSLREAVVLAQRLRQEGVQTYLHYDGQSLKAQMRRADKLGVKHVVILGEDELRKKVAILRDMMSQDQQEIPLKGIVERLKKN